MFGWLPWVLVGVAVAEGPAAVEAPKKGDGQGQFGIAFTDDFEVRYRQQDDRLKDFPDRAVFNYVEQVNRLTATATWRKWTAFAQVDEVALFANRYKLDGELTWERQLTAPDVWSPLPGDAYATLEKVFVKRDAEPVSFTIGDIYAAFGMGGVLNLNRNVDIDVDTSIQGARIVVEPGASFEIDALVGQLNRQQVWQDNPNILIPRDKRHLLAGLRVTKYGLGPFDLGVHATMVDFVEEPGWKGGFTTLGGPDVVAGGVSAQAYALGGVDWNFEGDVYGLPTELAVRDDKHLGYGLYGSGSFYIGRTTWLVEAKRYSMTERINAPVGPELYEIAVLPTLEYERAINEDTSAALNSEDIYGVRARVDVSAADGVLPFASMAIFRDEDLGGVHFNRVPETIVHPVVGAEIIRDEWTLLADIGFRSDFRDPPEPGDPALGGTWGADRQLHGDIDFKFPIAGKFHGDLALAGERWVWGTNPIQQTNYFSAENALTIQYGGEVALIGYLDYTDNPLVDSTGNLAENVYGAVELQVQPVPAWTIKAFYGAYKAGIRCSGGQCRKLPGFEGMRLSVVGSW